MIKNFNTYLVSFIENLHARLFGHEMSDRMRAFIRHLSFSFWGSTSASAILLVLSIFAGRLIGPEQFGKYALVLAIGQILIIPMMLGMDSATMRLLSIHQQNPEQQKKLVAAGLAAVSLASFTITILYLMFLIITPSRIIKLDTVLWSSAIFFTIIIVYKTFFESVARGLHLFKMQALVKFIESLICVIMFFIILKYATFENYLQYLAAVSAGGIVAIGIYGWRQFSLKSTIKNLDKNIVRELWQYGKFGLLGGIGGVLLISADRLLIKHYLGTYELGIYNAYSTASIMVGMQLSGIIVNVLFPFASQEKSKSYLLEKLDKLTLTFFIPGIIFMTLITFLAIRFFGRAYELNYALITSMGIYAVTNIVYLLYSSVISSSGPKWIFFTTRHSIIFGLIYLLIVNYLLPRIGIFAPATAFMLSIIYPLAIKTRLQKNTEFSHTKSIKY